MDHLNDKLGNPPLTEAVFTVKWALANVAQQFKFDVGLEEAVYKLRKISIEEYPRFERRLPPGFAIPITLNFEPFYRLLPSEGDYPQLELGSGVFIVRELGESYEFEAFAELVSTQIERLQQAYTDLADRDAVLQPRQLNFFQHNRIDLNEWDRFNGRSPGTTIASSFISDTLNYGVESPLRELDAATLFRQELSRTYQLADDIGVYTLTISDASNAPDRQVVEWEQGITFELSGSDFDSEIVTNWLRRAHRKTHQALKLLLSDTTLRAFIDPSNT